MKLSIIIPCYNCEKYINECLDSVLKALHDEDEVICVNDGSDDHTLALLNSVHDSRLKIITQKNMGPGAARNAGIDAASGEQIMFVDSDDIIPSTLIETVKNWSDVSLSNCQLCMKLTRHLKKLEYNNHEQLNSVNPQMVLSSGDVKLNILNADLPNAKKVYKNGYDISGPVVKTYCREILEKYHIRFPENLRWGEDICFNLQYFSHIKEVYFIPVNAYWYRKTPGSLINNYSPEKNQIIQDFLENVHNILNNEDNKVIKAFYYMVLKQYLYILQFDLCNRYNTESFSDRKKKALKLQNDNNLIREGIRHSSDINMNVSIAFMLFLIRIKCFAAVDVIMKLYTLLK